MTKAVFFIYEGFRTMNILSDKIGHALIHSRNKEKKGQSTVCRFTLFYVMPKVIKAISVLFLFIAYLISPYTNWQSFKFCWLTWFIIIMRASKHEYSLKYYTVCFKPGLLIFVVLASFIYAYIQKGNLFLFLSVV